MSFFCLEAGRISSRLIGTPRETRKRRRVRERTQFGGWWGGGATSWAQREAERGVRKMGFDVSEGVGVGWVVCFVSLVEGKRVSKWGVVAWIRSSKVVREEKSINGYE